MHARATAVRLRVAAAKATTTSTCASTPASTTSRTITFTSFFLLCIFTTLLGCGGGSTSAPTPPPPTPSATHLTVTAPATASSGISFQVTVTALNSAGTTATNYNGIVHFTSSDTRAAFSDNLQLSTGVGSMTVTLFTAAAQTITATDTISSTINGTSGSITVGSPQFAAAGDLNVAREFHTASLLDDGTVLIAGGDDGNLEHSSAELFDPMSGTFTLTASMATARTRATATRLSNGKILIVGGYGSGGQALDSAEIFDPMTKTFSSPGSMNTPRALHTAVLLPSGKVLVAGGVLTDGTRIGTAEVFDPESSTFSATGNLIIARAEHTATLLKSGTVLVAGGTDINGSGSPINSAELYEPNAGTFSAVSAAMTEPRQFFTATLLTDGTVLLAGGDNLITTNPSHPFKSTAEIFNSTTTTFSTVGSMNEARENHSATLLGDGSVLIVAGNHTLFTGGMTRTNVATIDTDTTELFQLPGSAGFAPQQTLANPRTNHTATTLPDGRLLIVGGAHYHQSAPGMQSQATVLASTELLE
jgi:hypothetical protein